MDSQVLLEITRGPIVDVRFRGVFKDYLCLNRI